MVQGSSLYWDSLYWILRVHLFDESIHSEIRDTFACFEINTGLMVRAILGTKPHRAIVFDLVYLEVTALSVAVLSLATKR